MKVNIVSNLERLKEMTLLQFNRTMEQCTIKELQQCLECMSIEDDFIHNEDICQHALDLLIL